MCSSDLERVPIEEVPGQEVTEEQATFNELLIPIAAEGPGTRMLFYPPKAAFRVGHIDADSQLSGQEWNQIEIGHYSVGMGYNSIASGNFTNVIGGANNRLGGAYTTALGGANNRGYGFFSTVLGNRVHSNHHGTFLFGDRRDGLPGQSSDEFFTTSEPNQFIIRTSGGMGVGTNITVGSALTLAGKPVLRTTFQSILPDNTDVTASRQIFDALKTDQYITDEGTFNKFMPTFTVQEDYMYYPLPVTVASDAVYEELAEPQRDITQSCSQDRRAPKSFSGGRRNRYETACARRYRGGGRSPRVHGIPRHNQKIHAHTTGHFRAEVLLFQPSDGR